MVMCLIDHRLWHPNMHGDRHSDHPAQLPCRGQRSRPGLDAIVVSLFLRDSILCPPTPHLASKAITTHLSHRAQSLTQLSPSLRPLFSSLPEVAVQLYNYNVHEKYCRKSFIQTMTIFITITLLNSNVFPFYDR